jgi:RND family efflux transporter MFP subunit
MKRTLRLSLLSAAVLIAAGAATLAMKPAASAIDHLPPASTAKSALTVTLTRPQLENWPQGLQLSGALAPWQLATVGAEENGLAITGLLVDVGSPVKRGQLLAQLDDAAAEANLKAQAAAVAQARAKWEQARSEAARSETIKDSGALSEQQQVQYRIAAQAAKAALDAAEATLASARISLQHTRIVAPDDGIIASRSATLGKVVSSGSELFTLVRAGRIERRAEVTAAQLPLLKPGQHATITLPGGGRIEGKLRIVAPTLDDNSRTALAYVDLPANSPARAGMYASGTLDIGVVPALSLPASAIVMRDGRSYVFAVDGSGHARQQPVQTGRRIGDRVEITAGLAHAAQVIESGGAFLNDGDAVRVIS